MTSDITPAQRDALERLARVVDSATYLAGGVAIALRLHHRQSRDIDLFSPSIDPAARAESIATTERDVRILSQSEGTLYLEVHGVPASWIRYRYPLLSPLEHLPGIPIPLASLEDLMCMKLAAIVGRGAARDFWDLYEILTQANITLTAALGTFARKYASHDIGHVVKSLVYFADADAAPLPEGLSAEHWQLIKSVVEHWVSAL
ncbi:MAG: nucleotidyl transferase AbiEii/AbiGii toxin family protein [Polyangiales bacterium]